MEFRNSKLSARGGVNVPPESELDINLLEGIVAGLSYDSIDEEDLQALRNLSGLEKEIVIDLLAEDLSKEELDWIQAEVFETQADGPEIDGYGRVSYYYRYLIYDRNQGDYDYIYVFRLGTSRCPWSWRHWYRWAWWCPSMYPIGGTYWTSYMRSGSLYYEFLFGKETVDRISCYGYLEMEYWN